MNHPLRILVITASLLGLTACEQPQSMTPAEVCSRDYDTFVEVRGWLSRGEPRCEPRRNLGPQCSYQLADAPGSDAAERVEVTILQGVASNQLEERPGPEGEPPLLFAHDMGNIPIASTDPVKVRGRVFRGLRDPETCRIEVLQIRPG